MTWKERGWVGWLQEDLCPLVLELPGLTPPWAERPRAAASSEVPLPTLSKPQAGSFANSLPDKVPLSETESLAF